jgi:hypothetical protein
MKIVRKKLVALTVTGTALIGGLAGISLAPSANAIPSGIKHVKVTNKAGFTAMMCVKNLSRPKMKASCTPKHRPVGSEYDLEIEAVKGDDLRFVVSIDGGHTPYHNIKWDENHCVVRGATLNPKQACMKD